MKLSERYALVVVILVALSFFGPFAQEAKSPDSAASPQNPSSNEIVTAVIPVQNVDVDEIVTVLHSFRNTLGGSISVSEKLRTISVSGSPAFVEACKEAAKKLDVPQPAARSIELTFTVLVASKAGGLGDDVPPELQGVVGQLKKLALFKSIRLADVQIVRVMDGGRPEIKGVASLGKADSERISYEVRAASADRVGSDKDVRIRLAKLWMAGYADKEGESSKSPIHDTFSSDVEFSEGQKAVIGSMGVTPTDSLILVVQARDVE